MAKIFKLKRDRTDKLYERRDALLQRLTAPPTMMRASCVEQFLTCGKSNCSCAGGRRHGPYLYLSLCLGVGKVRKFLLKTKEQQEQARNGARAYIEFMERLEELSQINAELLRRGKLR